jgi:GT2 family glycosyltransferase
MDIKRPRIGIVVLNYNSGQDLKICTEQLLQQRGVAYSIILVDNSSTPECLQEVREWLAQNQPDAISGKKDEIDQYLAKNNSNSYQPGQVFFIENAENTGYSSGNNVGIHLADKLQADAVLIVNPDMRIENPDYLACLAAALFAEPHYFIAASRILGLAGENQNPLREMSFWEELLWPLNYLKKWLGINDSHAFVITDIGYSPVVVPKVSGCCLMLKMDFLRATHYLDENTFLYCEEPILSARVHQMGGGILYVPSISAVHAHIKAAKGNVGKRTLQFIKSRLYYLKNYSHYSGLRLGLLYLSYALLTVFSGIRLLTNK